mgnify:CR=1 FL=1
MHSGTSVVAGTLRHLGVFMGNTFKDSSTHEDVLFATEFFSPRLVAYVNQRNKDHTVWGFKWPLMRHWFSSVEPYLKDPQYIYCHREGALKYSESIQEARQQEIAFWQEQNKEQLTIDFDMSQETRIQLLVDYLQLTPTQEQLDAALEFYNKERGYHAIR